jgi:Family of unknown function (DUF5681)
MESLPSNFEISSFKVPPATRPCEKYESTLGGPLKDEGKDRMPHGPFQPGQSGNSAGKPKGTRNKTTLAASFKRRGRSQSSSGTLGGGCGPVRGQITPLCLAPKSHQSFLPTAAPAETLVLSNE